MRMNAIYDRKENENGGVGSESSEYKNEMVKLIYKNSHCYFIKQKIN